MLFHDTLLAKLSRLACSGTESIGTLAFGMLIAVQTRTYEAAGRLERLDPRFDAIVAPGSVVERVADGIVWAEGPLWDARDGTLLFSDVPRNAIFRWHPDVGITLFMERSGYTGDEPFQGRESGSNGLTFDGHGRLVFCQHGNRRVVRREEDGRITVLADRFQGKRLNSPNDVVVKSDGSIWFSDPTYGIDSDYFGSLAESELDVACVYRLDPMTLKIEVVITSMIQPNGLAFSKDETQLLVVDSARTAGPHLPAHIRRFDLRSDGMPIDRGIVVEASAGLFDGTRLDEQDRIWAGTGEGVHCYSSDGRLLGKILTGGPIINLCFGGQKRNILYMCGAREVLRVPVRVRGQNTFLQDGNGS